MIRKIKNVSKATLFALVFALCVAAFAIMAPPPIG